jgi:serine/threonine-protein kinase
VAWQHVDNDVRAPSTIVKGLPAVLDDLVARATRRDPGARPTDAGALLAEVQAVRDDLGAASVETALLRQVPQHRHAVADATTVVPAVGDRPSWARLPEQSRSPQTYRRGSVGPVGASGGLDRRRVFISAAVAVMVLVIVGSTWWVTQGRYTETPSMVNMTRAQAELYAKQHDFGLTYGDGAYSETVPKDTVLRQTPGANERIAKGGTITLSLSLGRERYPVPDIVGLELAAAKSELAQSGLTFKQGGSQYSDTVGEGAVISTNPAKGTEVKRGDAVTVVVSKGKAPITVPNLVGQNVNDARTELQRLGLVAVERYKDSDKPADTVLAQTPSPGSGAADNDEITLDVSKGPPQVTVPDLGNQPCQQAAATLQGLNLRARIQGLQNGFVRGQNPGPNTPVDPQSEVFLQCF